MAYPEPLEELVVAFERFPGIGRRSAERLAFHVLRDPRARELAGAIERAVTGTRRCGTCCNVAETDPCTICADPKRDAGLLCVVEEPRHVEAIERSGAYPGRYHVLMGAFHPGDGTDEELMAAIGSRHDRVARGWPCLARRRPCGAQPDRRHDRQ